MKPNRLKERMLAKDPTLLNGWLTLGSVAAAEVMSRQAWDSLTIDMQHGLADFDTAVNMLRAISSSDVTPMVRVPWLDPALIMRMLDAGTYGVICPMINTRAQCEEFVACCRYAPQGARSFGPTRAPLYAGDDYWKHANETVLTFAMVETRQAVEAVDEIVSVPGLDGVYIGPSDLSLTLGLDPNSGLDHPDLLAAVDKIHAAAQRAGKFTVMHCNPIDYAGRMQARGFSLRTVSNDTRLLAMASQELLRQLKPAKI
jgi:4-hydroxy-2-oxoheptanedioate aldolase